MSSYDEWLATLAARPVDADGHPLCACGARVVHAEHGLECEACERVTAARREREHRAEVLAQQRDTWRARVTGALGTLPPWEHARSDSPDLADKTHKRFFAAASKADLTRGPLALLGPTGTGKTTTATALAWRYAEPVLAAIPTAQRAETWQVVPEWRVVETTLFVRANEIVRALRAHPLGKGDPPLFIDALRASLLIVDDLGNEQGGFEQSTFELIDERYEKHRPLIVTSGFRRADLERRYSEALIRRFVEPRGAIVDVWGADG